MAYYSAYMDAPRSLNSGTRPPMENPGSRSPAPEQVGLSEGLTSVKRCSLVGVRLPFVMRPSLRFRQLLSGGRITSRTSYVPNPY